MIPPVPPENPAILPDEAVALHEKRVPITEADGMMAVVPPLQIVSSSEVLVITGAGLTVTG